MADPSAAGASPKPNPARVELRRLGLRDFRNIEGAAIEPARRLNVLHGRNGHGKTSLIEALYVLATTRSFRSQKIAEVIRQGTLEAELVARVWTLGVEEELRARLGARGRSFTRDGKAAKRRLEYALRTPVVAFHPQDMLLVSGPASLRRNLLDRITVYLDPEGGEARLRYQEALRERQRLLQDKGPAARELDSYEAVLGAHGARFAKARRLAFEALRPHVLASFGSMSAAGLSLGIDYGAGGSEDSEVFARELRARRPQDTRRGSASFGPQRDEIELLVDGRPGRTHASQGQQRLLTLALKLGELEVVRSASLLHPILLLDDVSSELDAERTSAVFDFLRNTESQVFVTTTRPELFAEAWVRPEERAVFRVESGRVTRDRT